MAVENMEFKAEIRELLSLVIHSVYSNKDIFLRELIANAADAIDKARFLALTKPEMTRDWEIRLEADKENKALTISDNGVGMSKDELVENLGTIAHSGTKAFAAALEQAKDGGGSAPELIGQFGVGFYSAFMAADRVTVESRKDGAEGAWKWTSDGKDEFTLEETSKEVAGTRVTLYLKDDFASYLDYWKISELVRKYSDFIEYPIRMKHMVRKEADKEAEEDSTLNTMKAIWLRPESEVTEEEYDSFYQHISMNFDKPLKRISFHAEGASEFKSLLFLASKMPFNYRFGMNKDPHNIQLYVRRVFITDNCPGLLPEYMGFVNGVVDSSDLPLNVSRETLQDNPQIARISKSITKRVLSELEKTMEKERPAYEGFYREFSALLKGGVHTDFGNRDKLRDLLLFESMNHPAGKFVSLKEYSDAMPAAQKAIYYIAGDRREALEHSPQLEMFRKQGFDVLFLYEPIDEFIMDDLGKYAEKDLVSVLKGEVKFDESVQKEIEEKTKKETEDNQGLVAFLKTALADKVKDVRFSARLTESPCCLVGDAADPSANMQRIFKAMGQAAPDVKRILELNGDSPLIQALKSLYEKDASSVALTEYAELLYDQALIAEGAVLPDPAKFAKQTVRLMTDSIRNEIGGK